MARCSHAKPFCATAPPRLSRHRRQLSANATSPAISTSKARLPALNKPAKPPPPPLLTRPKLPVPTTTTHTTAGDKDCAKKPPPEATPAPPPSSGAGDVLRLLDALGLPPDEEVYISLLRDCADATEVAAVHAHIACRCAAAAGGLPLPLANRVLLSYAACGDIGAARQVFDEMPWRNGMAWATMVSAYSDGCFHHEAIHLFALMCREARDLTGDGFAHTTVAVLRSCTRVSQLRLGEQVQALVFKKGRVCGDIGSALVQLYCESGGGVLHNHKRARQVLLMMMRHRCQEPVPEAAWTSLITACHRDGLLDEAIDVFRDMVSAGVPRSSFSLSSILAVFAESEDHQHQGCCGQQVHADAIKRGVDTNQFVGSGLVHMYAKQGRLADATRAFEAIGGKPDTACWSAMAMAYARGGRHREAARVMYRMKAAGMNPSEEMTDAVRLACFG
ncbi:Pentatricopeptide repeat-containing protein [Dichanthelium oligosanthes]|uniref:Pentatricopeptide repeat-containing protein n=1 Tax=Dichanthelium oligosanthes TaxID=888268 RepID=A0A1E5W1Z6_9POAL|nr:Pentatricopeptide repeat-containing protein [Dichanthelium oligosanthes]